MKETPFYFRAGEGSLFGVLHEPVGQSREAFVFCHPLGEEKLWAHRVFVNFARHLAEQGHTVLRFDFAGGGDSDGDFERTSLTTACRDLRAAIDEVRRVSGTSRVCLVGLRLGATIAGIVAEEVPDDVHLLVLWAPIVDGSRYMQELLRINLTTQMSVYKEIRQDREAMVAAMQQGGTVNVDGYEMAFPLFSEVSAVKLADAAKRHGGPCLIVQIDKQPRPAPELSQLGSSHAHATMTFAEEEPFWKEVARFYDRAPNLFSKTAEWLKAQLV